MVGRIVRCVEASFSVKKDRMMCQEIPRTVGREVHRVGEACGRGGVKKARTMCREISLSVGRDKAIG